MRDLMAEVLRARDLGCGQKYVGAVAADAIRRELRRAGVRVSQVNVYVAGVRIEVDLLVLLPGVPLYQRVYRASDVYAAIEVKAMGAWPGTRGKVAADRAALRAAGVERFVYVTVNERRGDKYPPVGEDVYTLAWHGSREVDYELDPDAWMRLVCELTVKPRR